ncbi:pq loop repeat protein [Niveomyces insectorum RCEF 264]|uniref:Pq loop repeat protein n=1 Tax=Niveomyces insectorum RCEF 264 TaxID=1081102 RepID=A0A167N2E7_9HYPO|nr:pq loop repeat protein [Niveomyces insectorum RCEF 264]
MVPPTGPLNLDVEAVSGICGSISIACWIIVFSPQIIENFRRGNADGLSLQFLIVWLLGDVFNILGAVLQGVLPTMIILAVYYTIADIVLLGQCFYYRGFTWRDAVVPPKPKRTRRRRTDTEADDAGLRVNGGGGGRHRRHRGDRKDRATERTALLAKTSNGAVGVGVEDDVDGNDRHNNHHQQHHQHQHQHPHRHGHERRDSNWSSLSPAVPFVPELRHLDSLEPAGPVLGTTAPPQPTAATTSTTAASGASPRRARAASTTVLQSLAFHTLAMLTVCAAGAAGWYLSGGRTRSGGDDRDHDNRGRDTAELVLDLWGQVFGYLCAALYLGSRLPQLLLNWRRRSTDGVSLLFFLFACLGNLTYVLSIVAYDGCGGSDEECTPAAVRARYGRYLLVNLPWLAGSLGTLLLDLGIFVQFFLYRVEEEGGGEDDEDDGSSSSNSGGSDSYAGGTAADDNDYDKDSDDDDDDDAAYRDERPLLRRNLSSYH